MRFTVEQAQPEGSDPFAQIGALHALCVGQDIYPVQVVRVEGLGERVLVTYDLAGAKIVTD